MTYIFSSLNICSPSLVWKMRFGLSLTSTKERCSRHFHRRVSRVVVSGFESSLSDKWNHCPRIRLLKVSWRAFADAVDQGCSVGAANDPSCIMTLKCIISLPGPGLFSYYALSTASPSFPTHMHLPHTYGHAFKCALCASETCGRAYCFSTLEKCYLLHHSAVSRT